MHASPHHLQQQECEGLDESVERLASERHLPQRYVAAWRSWDARDQEALLRVARSLKLRTGQLMVAIELLPEVALQQGLAIAEFLGREELRHIIDGPGSAPQRAHAFIEALRTFRYPRLNRMLKALKDELKAAKLLPFVKVALPKELSCGELRIELRLTSQAQLDAALKVLADNRHVFLRMLRILDGTDEV